MDAYSLTDAAGRLDELVGRAEAGEEIALTRDGQVVAHLKPVGPQRIDIDALRRVAATLPFDPIDSVAEMRRTARY